MTNYARGRRLEWKSRDWLLTHGRKPLAVLRTAGSHGIADLVAVYPDYVSLIQVKGAPISLAERLELAKTYDAITNHGSVTLVVHTWRFRKREPEVEFVNSRFGLPKRLREMESPNGASSPSDASKSKSPAESTPPQSPT